MDEHILTGKSQILYVWQGSKYASKVGHKKRNKITFESFVGLECC